MPGKRAARVGCGCRRRSWRGRDAAGTNHLVTSGGSKPVAIAPGAEAVSCRGQREAVNQWIRTSGAFDGVIGFDAAVRDPASPLRLLPAYDSGVLRPTSDSAEKR
jgi:hypothetical protein